MLPCPFTILFLVDCGFERLGLVPSVNHHAEAFTVFVLRLLQWAQRHGAEVSNALKVLEPQATGDRTCHSQERLEEGPHATSGISRNVQSEVEGVKRQ